MGNRQNKKTTKSNLQVSLWRIYKELTDTRNNTDDRNPIIIHGKQEYQISKSHCSHFMHRNKNNIWVGNAYEIVQWLQFKNNERNIYLETWIDYSEFPTSLYDGSAVQTTYAYDFNFNNNAHVISSIEEEENTNSNESIHKKKTYQSCKLGVPGGESLVELDTEKKNEELLIKINESTLMDKNNNININDWNGFNTSWNGNIVPSKRSGEIWSSSSFYSNAKEEKHTLSETRVINTKQLQDNGKTIVPDKQSALKGLPRNNYGLKQRRRVQRIKPKRVEEAKYKINIKEIIKECTTDTTNNPNWRSEKMKNKGVSKSSNSTNSNNNNNNNLTFVERIDMLYEVQKNNINPKPRDAPRRIEKNRNNYSYFNEKTPFVYNNTTLNYNHTVTNQSNPNFHLSQINKNSKPHTWQSKESGNDLLVWHEDFEIGNWGDHEEEDKSDSDTDNNVNNYDRNNEENKQEYEYEYEHEDHSRKYETEYKYDEPEQEQEQEPGKEQEQEQEQNQFQKDTEPDQNSELIDEGFVSATSIAFDN